jgi:hypothetical protein
MKFSAGPQPWQRAMDHLALLLLSLAAPPPKFWLSQARGSRSIPGVNDIKAAVLEVYDIARGELSPSRLGNGRDLSGCSWNHPCNYATSSHDCKVIAESVRLAFAC